MGIEDTAFISMFVPIRGVCGCNLPVGRFFV